MATFAEGEKVLVRPDSQAVYVERAGGERFHHYLASTPGIIAAGSKPEMGLYLVRFNLGDNLSDALKTIDYRDLEAY